MISMIPQSSHSAIYFMVHWYIYAILCLEMRCDSTWWPYLGRVSLSSRSCACSLEGGRVMSLRSSLGALKHLQGLASCLQVWSRGWEMATAVISSCFFTSTGALWKRHRSTSPSPTSMPPAVCPLVVQAGGGWPGQKDKISLLFVQNS